MAGGLQKKKREGGVKAPPKGKALPGKKKKRGTKIPPISGY